jgi:hypothetical protein
LTSGINIKQLPVLIYNSKILKVHVSSHLPAMNLASTNWQTFQWSDPLETWNLGAFRNRREDTYYRRILTIGGYLLSEDIQYSAGSFDSPEIDSGELGLEGRNMRVEIMAVSESLGWFLCILPI